MSNRKCWAFLVGINQYTGYASLNYCVDDVRSLESLLNQVGYTPVCLHDRLESRNGRFPSRTNILAELDMLLKQVKANDLLLVYFACHGWRGENGKPILIAADTRKIHVETTGISIMDDLEPRIQASPAQQKILMLDACFMGQGRGQQDPTAFLRRVNDLASGYEVIAASSETQEALESSGLNHSIFCHFVLQALAGEADMGQGLIMLSGLKNYVLDGIAEYTVRLSLEQEPQGRSLGNLGDFLLVDYTVYQRPQLDLISPPTEDTPVGLTVRGRGRSPSQIIECLWSLDYDAQHQTFRNCTPRSRRAAAFVVQARDSRIQYWLVKRLVNQIPNVAHARVFPFVVPNHPMWKNRDFNEVWVDLARKLNCAAVPAKVIDTLVKVYQTQPIIFALYGWSDRPRSQQLQQQVLNELWNPLVQEVAALPTQPMRSRLVLFLAEGGDIVPDIPAGNDSDLSIPIRLHPLTAISSDQVATWIESDAVYPVVTQFRSEAQIRTLIEEEIAEWNCDPVETLEQICYIFELENGIADIEAEWRWAG
ncbi:MAG: caspase family protein [Leptolyngbyaceae cyanobacterium]